MARKKPTENTVIPITRPTGQEVVIYSFPYYLCDKELVELTISELIKLDKKTGRYGYQVFTLDFGIGSVETIATKEPYTREELEQIYDRIEDGKLAIDSINHHPFTQQTEELKEGFKVARWSYNPTEKTIAFWKAA